jgi:2-dehydro-3-deoxygalactonokinase
LLHESFLVRTNDLLGKMSRKENLAYLSGLLIGEELKNIGHGTIVLASSGELLHLYNMAIELLDTGTDLIVVPETEMERAVSIGQLAIFKKIIESDE